MISWPAAVRLFTLEVTIIIVIKHDLKDKRLLDQASRILPCAKVKPESKIAMLELKFLFWSSTTCLVKQFSCWPCSVLNQSNERTSYSELLRTVFECEQQRALLEKIMQSCRPDPDDLHSPSSFSHIGLL